MTSRPGVRVFISYAHLDDALRVRLRVYLRPLERERRVLAWDDRAILAGDQWADEIDARLEDADIVLLLVTADFMNSEYCFGKELKRALERNADPADRAIVIPIILHKCDWETSAFAHLQALPPGSPPRPLSEWKSEADYYTAVVKGLRERIQAAVDPRSSWVDRARERLRDPLWWQRPLVWGSAIGAIVLAGALSAWWWLATARIDADIVQAEKAMRSGRHGDAVELLKHGCGRWGVGRPACFTLEKARLGALLERADAPPLEAFAAQVAALRSRTPEDPDLLFLSAQLALRDRRSERQTQALRDIDAAIRLTGDAFPEANFVLADRQLREGRYAAALPLLDRAIALVDVTPDHYRNMRGYARAQTGNIAGAIEDYELSAESGSILSRIELAELLWGRSEIERALDQLQTAVRTLGSGNATLAGRNVLPWSFELGPGRTVVLRQAAEKRCYAAWMAELGRALAGHAAQAAVPAREDCGAEAQRIEAAVAASLARAIRAGMNTTASQRAAEFAKQHRLALADVGGGT